MTTSQAQDAPKARILMVDDHPENLLALEAILSGLGEELVRASSGREALQQVLANDFALILMDVVMPEMDGFETAELIRQRKESRQTPIIFLTANHSDDAHVFKGYSVGAVSYMIKPLVPEVLRSKVGVFVELYKKRSAIERAERELRRARDELEKRVQERTAELAAAIKALEAENAERRRVEQERSLLLRREQQARLEAERANRIKDQFLATLSHELGTPLSAILGWTHLLGLGKLDEETVQRGISALRSSAQAQAQLIGDILDLSGIIGGKLRLHVASLHPQSIIEAAVDAVRPAAAAKEVKIEVRLSPPEDEVFADPDRLRQVIGNLLSNAIKFTRKGGHVYVDLFQAGTDVRIQVRDTGIGISPDFLPYLFDDFTQADSSLTRSHGGLGLGMAITRHLVELHGGTVRAESEGEGKGATFTVTLPMRPAVIEPEEVKKKGKTVTAEVAPSDLPSLEGVRILVVDDRPEAREVLSLMLMERGGDVIAVGSAREALQAVLESKPHIVVSDIAMPDEDGYDLITKIRALDPGQGGLTPAVAVSAYATAQDAERALTAGFQSHVPKPICPTDLINTVAQLAGSRNSR